MNLTIQRLMMALSGLASAMLAVADLRRRPCLQRLRWVARMDILYGSKHRRADSIERLSLLPLGRGGGNLASKISAISRMSLKTGGDCPSIWSRAITGPFT
jgi:hypothetical protein